MLMERLSFDEILQFRLLTEPGIAFDRCYCTSLQQRIQKMSLSIDDHKAIPEAHKRLTRHIKIREPEKAANVMYEHRLDVTRRLKV